MARKKRIIIWITGCVVTLTVGIFALIPFVVMNPMVNKHVDFQRIWKAEEFGLEANHFFVKTEDGVKISTYEVEVDSPKAVVICLSGIHNPSVTAFFGHAQLFSKHNYATILLDMRAHGESEGDKIYLGFKEYLDIKAVVEYVKNRDLYKNVPVVVMGLSMGGATAINSIGEIPEIDGLISLSAFSSWEEVFYENMKKSVPSLIAKIEYPFVYLATFLKYGTNSFIKPKNEIRNLGNRPALLVHSREDSQISFANFERLMDAAPDQVEIFVKEGDFHLILENFVEIETDKEYSDTIIGFLNKNFGK